MPDLAIDAHHLKKTFTTRTGFWSGRTKTTTAVGDISFHVQRGELFGLLGPNGAGKTTTVKMLSTLLLPTAGTISILGRDILRETNTVRKHIGFTFGGARGLYGRLSALDNLRYFAELYALEPDVAARRIPELLEVVGLKDRGGDRVETFSSGMQQRLHLARALLHDPELIYLDEPTVGIDPVGARELRAAVKELVARGKTILLTTHYMAEAEELCDHIAIVNHGRIVAEDTPYALKQRITGESVIDLQVSPADVDSIRARLAGLNGNLSMEVGDLNAMKQLSIRTSEPEPVLQLLAGELGAGLIRGMEVRSQTLEDVYVAIIKGDQG
jgi:ABC-2 type transport system ATP-binding protein